MWVVQNQQQQQRQLPSPAMLGITFETNKRRSLHVTPVVVVPPKHRPHSIRYIPYIAGHPWVSGFCRTSLGAEKKKKKKMESKSKYGNLCN